MYVCMYVCIYTHMRVYAFASPELHSNNINICIHLHTNIFNASSTAYTHKTQALYLCKWLAEDAPDLLHAEPPRALASTSGGPLFLGEDGIEAALFLAAKTM